MRDVADILTSALVDREARIRQGKVVSIQAGPPRSVTVDISGVSYPGIRIMNHVDPTVAEGVWILDMGIGRWLIFGTNSSAQTTSQFVKITGDSMTGALNVNSGGNETLTLRGTNSYIGFYNLAGRLGYLQSVQSDLSMRLASDGGLINFYSVGGFNFSGGRVDFGGQNLQGLASISTSTFNINGYTGSTGVVGNRIVLADANGYIWTNYFNMTADFSTQMQYAAGRDASTNFIRWYSVVYVSQVEGYSQMGVSWANSAVIANPGAGNAACAYHCGGVAPVHYTSNGFGNNIYCRDSIGNSGSANHTALAHPNESSRRWKKNINDWPLKAAGAAVQTATDLLVKLRPVTFQITARDVEVPSYRRMKAWDRLNQYRAHRGMEPYELPAHDCSIHDCNGTAEKPCIRIIHTEKERYGFIAEEVYEVAPSVVTLDRDWEPEGIDPGQLLTIAIATIQELTERVNLLEDTERNRGLEGETS